MGLRPGTAVVAPQGASNATLGREVNADLERQRNNVTPLMNLPHTHCLHHHHIPLPFTVIRDFVADDGEYTALNTANTFATGELPHGAVMSIILVIVNIEIKIS